MVSGRATNVDLATGGERLGDLVANRRVDAVHLEAAREDRERGLKGGGKMREEALSSWMWFKLSAGTLENRLGVSQGRTFEQSPEIKVGPPCEDGSELRERYDAEHLQVEVVKVCP